MVVAIAGNYDWEAFVSLVERHFTPFAAASGDARAPQAQAFTPGRLAREKDTEQTHLCLGFPGVPSDSDDLYALSVLGNALGRGHLLLGRVRTPEETLSRIEAVTPDAVMELARRLLGQKASAAIVGRGAEALLARIGG